MRKQATIRAALKDPKLLGHTLAGNSWAAWRKKMLPYTFLTSEWNFALWGRHHAIPTRSIRKSRRPTQGAT